MKGESAQGFERFSFQARKSRPFLRRNVYSAQAYSSTMGSAISTLAEATGLAPAKSVESLAALSAHEDVEEDGDDNEEDIRPAKRRKTTTFMPSATAPRFPSESPRRKPFGHVTNESRRVQSRLSLTGKLQAVQPSVFYGKSGSIAPAASANMKSKHWRPEKDRDARSFSIDEHFLPKYPADFEGALKMEILGIERKPEEDEERPFDSLEGPLDIECRCVVTLYYLNKDGSAQEREGEMICSQNRTCTLRTTLTEDGDVKREVIWLRPFFFTAGELFVNRKQEGPLGMQTRLGWADIYMVRVSLRPKGSPRQWPPFHIEQDGQPGTVADLLYAGEAQKEDVILICSTQKFLSPNHQDRAVDLKITLPIFGDNTRKAQKVPFGLRMRFKWSLSSPMEYRSIKAPQTESPRNIELENPASAVPPSPLAVKGQDNNNADSHANERAHRKRSNIPATYNLKALSAQAQGKSPRASKVFRSRADLGDSKGTNVMYFLGKAEASDFGTRQQTTVPGVFCPFCCSYKNALEDLIAHLQTEHTSFKFSLRGTSIKPRIYVEVIKQPARSDPALDKLRTSNLGKPQTLFDLQKYLSGDNSWAKSREREGHNDLPEHLKVMSIDHIHDSSSSPYDSQYSSPNTSNDTDGMYEYENHQFKPHVHIRKKFCAPQTKKPLYNPLTKQVLQAGDELPSSDDEKDEAWLYQKHRDIIMDFSDVTAEEKDYITKWNPFCMDLQLSSEYYLPDTVLRFADENKGWFLQRKSRKEEFGKMMETYVMRGVISQDCFSKAVDILRQAERFERENGGDVHVDHQEESPILPAKQRGGQDCICGEHTQPPDRVICEARVSGGLPWKY